MPLIFDDSFALYDDERLKTALNGSQRPFKGQIIVLFTCHQREAQLLTANQIGYSLSDFVNKSSPHAAISSLKYTPKGCQRYQGDALLKISIVLLLSSAFFTGFQPYTGVIASVILAT